jgi:hypothetical protein
LPYLLFPGGFGRKTTKSPIERLHRILIVVDGKRRNDLFLPLPFSPYTHLFLFLLTRCLGGASFLDLRDPRAEDRGQGSARSRLDSAAGAGHPPS